MRLSGSQKTALIANFSYILDISAFAVILPFLSAEILSDPGQGLTAYSVYGFSLSATLILGGILTDRMPVRILFIAGVFLYAFAASLIVFAESFLSLLVLRGVQGVGAALFSPCVPLIISRSGDANSAESLTIWGFWSGIVAAASPVVFSTLIILFEWRVAWLIVPFIAFVAILNASKIDESFRLGQRHRPSANRVTSNLMFAYVFISYGITTWFIYAFPLHAEELFGLSPLAIGVYSTLLWGVFATVCWFMRSLENDSALFASLRVSALLLIAAAVTFNLSPLSVVLAGAAMALANMPTTELILRDTQSKEYGLVASLDITCARLGGALSVIVIPKDAPVLIISTGFLAALLLGFCSVAQRNSQNVPSS
ncbi:MFS transporter [Dinoroseobacter sp. S76]|uniref:MFS transporter n=1 Tax=Dinoroseobacter sp. S76 TaxID=3415124 RepID=UPI003C798363